LLNQLRTDGRDLGAQRGDLFLEFSSTLFRVGDDLLRALLRLGRDVERALARILEQGVHFPRSFVEKLQTLVEQSLRLYQAGLLPCGGHKRRL
jgi:hypothetical protein